MGQGAEDAGGYEITYDPYEDGLAFGEWIQSDGSTITPDKMATGHLRNAIRLCERNARCATFSCEEDKWSAWIDIFETELAGRSSPQQSNRQSAPPSSKKPTRGKKQTMKCHCGAIYEARVAELKRGNAKSCSKRCAAIRRDYGRPPAKPVNC